MHPMKRVLTCSLAASLLALTATAVPATDWGGKKAVRFEQMTMDTAAQIVAVVNPPKQINGLTCVVAGLVALDDVPDIAFEQEDYHKYGCGVRIFVRPDVLEAVDRGEVSRLELTGLMAHEVAHAIHGDAWPARRATTTLSQREHEADIEGARIMYKLAGLEGVEAMAHFFENTDRFKKTDAEYGTPQERGAAIRAAGRMLVGGASRA